MKKQIDIKGKSQYEADISPVHRPSACGPVTAFVLLRHLAGAPAHSVDDLYSALHCTKIGLSARRFIRGINRLLPADWRARRCTVQEALKEIDAGRPAAVKFDKWFRMQWRGSFSFDYHWVVLTGYEYIDDELFLLVHDNGSRHYPSRIRSIPYEPNKKILTFVAVQPLKIDRETLPRDQ